MFVTECKDEFKNGSNPVIMPLCYAMWRTIANSLIFMFYDICVANKRKEFLCQ